MPTPATPAELEQLVVKLFAEDITDHQMEVVLDTDTHRHLRFRAPGTSLYGFDVLTWPGTLTIHGDMGTFVFSRTSDMFEFFRSNRPGINPDYWAQKLTASSPLRAYSPEYATVQIRDAVEEWARDAAEHAEVTAEVIAEVRAQVEADVLTCTETEHELREALARFSHEQFDFDAAYYEWNFELYSTQFLWCCHAIRWAIHTYDTAKATAAATAPDAESAA